MIAPASLTIADVRAAVDTSGRPGAYPATRPAEHVDERPPLISLAAASRRLAVSVAAWPTKPPTALELQDAALAVEGLRRGITAWRCRPPKTDAIVGDR